MTQILERKEVGQSLWLLMDNTRIRLRIGIIYAPQESQSSVNDLKVIYREIEDQAEEAKRNKRGQVRRVQYWTGQDRTGQD